MNKELKEKLEKMADKRYPPFWDDGDGGKTPKMYTMTTNSAFQRGAEWVYSELSSEVERLRGALEEMKKNMIPKGVVFSLVNRFYGSDYPMEYSIFENALSEALKQ